MNANTMSLHLLDDCQIIDRLSIAGAIDLAVTFNELVGDQDERLAVGDQPTRIPLLWVSLAELVGLTVDADGRIVDGPRTAIPGL